MSLEDICHQIQLSPDNDFSKLLRTILNEIQSPILEVYDLTRVNSFRRMISTQENTIKKLKDSNDVGSETLLHCQIYEMEINRIEYYLTLYTKTRLRKIHEMVKNGITEHLNKMTRNESELYKKYQELHKKFFEKSGVENPEFQNTLDDNRYVFVRILKEIDNFKIHPDDEDAIQMNPGEIYLLPYKSIHDFVNTDSVELI